MSSLNSFSFGFHKDPGFFPGSVIVIIMQVPYKAKGNQIRKSALNVLFTSKTHFLAVKSPLNFKKSLYLALNQVFITFTIKIVTKNKLAIMGGNPAKW